jgi:hypothetical protein
MSASKSWFSNLLPAITNAKSSATLNSGQSKVDPNNFINQTVKQSIIDPITGLVKGFTGDPTLPDNANSYEQAGNQLAYNVPLTEGIGPAIHSVLPALGMAALGMNDAGKLVKILKGGQEVEKAGVAAEDVARATKDLPLGTSLERDLRFKQGNPSYKINPNPEVPTYGIKQETPKTGLTPQDLPPIVPPVEKPNVPIPPYNPPIRGVNEVGKPGNVHILVGGHIDDAAKLKTAQTAVDNIPGLTATDKFTNLSSRMGELSDQIKSYNASHPVNIPESEIKDSIINQVKPLIAPEGTDLVEAHQRGLITQPEANIIADDTVRQLKLQAGIKTPTIGATSDLPIDQITQMKQSYNKLYGNLLSKRVNGGNLAPYEQIQLASRDGLDSIIGTKQPQIKNLSLEQSGLYNAEEQLGKLQNTEYAQSQNPKQGILNKVFGNKKADALALGIGVPTVLAGGAYALNKMTVDNPSATLNDQTASPSAQLNSGIDNKSQQANNGVTQSQVQSQPKNVLPDITSHNTSIPPVVNNDPYSLPVKLSDIDPEKTPVADPTAMKMANGQPVSISEAQHRQVDAAIAQYRADHPNDVNATAEADAQQKINDNRFNPKMIDSANKVVNAKNSYIDAMNLLNNPKPHGLDLPNIADTVQIMGMGVQGFQGGLSGPYAQLSKDFHDIDAAYPELHLNLETSGSPENAKAKLKSALQTIMSKHNQLIKTYVGTKPEVTPTVTDTSSTATPFVAPTGNSQLPQITPAQTNPYQLTTPNPDWGKMP